MLEASEKRYLIRSAVEIYPLDSSSNTRKYVLKAGNGGNFVISENLKRIIDLFREPRTFQEAANILSQEGNVSVSESQIRKVATDYLEGYGLLEEGTGPSVRHREESTSRRSKVPFDFTFRLPMISAKVSRPIVERLIWLYHPVVVITSVILISLTHIEIYRNPIPTKPWLLFSAWQFVILYLIGIATVLFHELGHAAACKKYKCEHGDIGIMLYLIVPAFYVNLSNAWRLPARQRAVIDAGGMYFQLLLTFPLYILSILTGSIYFPAAIYSIDLMVLISLIPLFKFDGYWLLVDLTGLVNLHRRGWRTVKDTMLWCLGLRNNIPAVSEVSGAWKQILLIVYSFLSLVFFISLFLLLLWLAPGRFTAFYHHLLDLLSVSGGAEELPRTLGKILFDIFFMLFIWRMLNSMINRFLRKDGRKGQV